MSCLNNEIEIIEINESKNELIRYSKDYINLLINKDLQDTYMKLGYEVTTTSINYTIIKTVEDSYFNDVDILVSYKKIEK